MHGIRRQRFHDSLQHLRVDWVVGLSTEDVRETLVWVVNKDALRVVKPSSTFVRWSIGVVPFCQNVYLKCSRSTRRFLIFYKKSKIPVLNKNSRIKMFQIL